jgi:hypothetical protein
MLAILSGFAPLTAAVRFMGVLMCDMSQHTGKMSHQRKPHGAHK